MIDTALFSQTNPSGGQKLSASTPPHASQHGNLNDEVTAVEDTLRMGIIREAATTVRIDAARFTVAGDVTSYYSKGRPIYFNGDVATRGWVYAASYSAPNTTVTVCGTVVPSPLTNVDLGLVPFTAEAEHVGKVVWLAKTATPLHHLALAGGAFSRIDFKALFTEIGTVFGAGDGSTTFNVPNLRGRLIVGQDATQVEFDALGETGGAKTHTLVIAEMPAHTHVQDAHGHALTDPGHTHIQDAHTHIQNAHTHIQDPHSHAVLAQDLSPSGTAIANPSFTSSAANKITGNTTAVNQYTTATNQNTTATNQNNTTGITLANTTAVNQNTGGGGAHNNLAPYIVLVPFIRY